MARHDRAVARNQFAWAHQQHIADDDPLGRPVLNGAVANTVGDARCEGVGVVLSAEPARGVCRREGARLVDRFTVWREGAQAIWLRPDGPRIVSDRAERGNRPWVPPLVYPHHNAAPVPPPDEPHHDEQ